MRIVKIYTLDGIDFTEDAFDDARINLGADSLVVFRAENKLKDRQYPYIEVEEVD